MTTSNSGRRQRRLSTLRNPRKVIDQERAAYLPRFGSDFANRVRLGSWLVVVGVWTMIVGLVGMFAVGVIVFFATGSLAAVYAAMYAGFGLIILGLIVNSIGVAMRNSPIKKLSDRIMTFDPNVTPLGAAKLIKTPHLYDRWTNQHPGFEP